VVQTLEATDLGYSRCPCQGSGLEIALLVEKVVRRICTTMACGGSWHSSKFPVNVKGLVAGGRFGGAGCVLRNELG
jgi:hypothetical protein